MPNFGLIRPKNPPPHDFCVPYMVCGKDLNRTVYGLFEQWFIVVVRKISPLSCGSLQLLGNSLAFYQIIDKSDLFAMFIARCDDSSAMLSNRLLR